MITGLLTSPHTKCPPAGRTGAKENKQKRTKRASKGKYPRRTVKSETKDKGKLGIMRSLAAKAEKQSNRTTQEGLSFPSSR